MNPAQMAQQIKHLLEQAQWPGGLQEAVYGEVAATASLAASEPPRRRPWAVVVPGGGSADPEHPDVIEREFDIYSGAQVWGDRLGESALSGGNISDVGRSAGKGVSEISARARATLQKLTGADGAAVQVSAAQFAAFETQGNANVVADQFSVSAVCTSLPSYSEPQMLFTDDDQTTTRWLWEGAHCEARYDFMQYRLVKKLGTTPSVDPSDGTVVYTGTTSQVDETSESGYTYTVFADYSARGNGLIDGSSEPEVGAYLYVT